MTMQDQQVVDGFIPVGAVIHVEWFDHTLGRDVLLKALTAAIDLIVPDGAHVYEPAVLDYRADEWGEMDLWFSVRLMPGATYRQVIDRIRAAGLRVKTAGAVDLQDEDVLTADMGAVWGWWER